jgi:hypothetical protein
MAQTQELLLVAEKMKLAKNDCQNNNVHHSERTHTFIADYGQNMALKHTFIVDYGQNMALPFVGATQPGEMRHYYTPINIYNQYCHVFSEGDGKKGGNKVASILTKSLFWFHYKKT